MFRLTNFRSPSLLVLSLFLGLQAMAQFEVSPDHFDSPAAKQTVHRRTAAKVQSKTLSATKTTTLAAHKSSARKNKSAATSRRARQQTTAALGAKIEPRDLKIH